MPPSQPSSAKKRGGKKKEKSEPTSNRDREERKKQEQEDDDFDDLDEEKLAHEFLTSTSLGRRMAQSEAYRLVAATACAVPNPDVPPCDNCSKPFSGSMKCSRCESVFYCDRECQVAHWTASHKLQCAEIKQQNDEIAKDVIENFMEDVDAWTELDVAGAYKAAVHHGLHNKIREAMQSDYTTIDHRYEIGNADDFFVYTPYITRILFRGQRAEGRKAEGDFSNCYDGIRIREYVKSHPDALKSWLEVSFGLVMAVADPRTLRCMPDLHRNVHDAAHAVWSNWELVFASSTASRAVLLVPRRNDAAAAEDESQAAAEQRRKRASEDHVRKLAIRLGTAYRRVWDLRESAGHLVDPNALLCDIGLVAAMVHLRAQEYKIGVNVEQVLNFQGLTSQMFRRWSIPVAKRTIEKGHRLNPQEANAVMALVTRAGLLP